MISPPFSKEYIPIPDVPPLLRIFPNSNPVIAISLYSQISLEVAKEI